MTDGHADDAHDVVVSHATRRLLRTVTVALVVALAVGVVVLWPGALRSDAVADAAGSDDLITATVTAAEQGPCEGTQPEDGITCTAAIVRLHEGPDAGEEIELFEEPVAGGLALEVGDEVVLGYYADAEPGLQYALADYERRTPLLLLGALFAIAIAALARVVGLRALVGVGVSIAVLAVFILPALLDGRDPVLVTLVGAGVIAVVTLYLAHGVNARSTVALLGTLASLALVGLLAWLFVELTRLTGRPTGETLSVQVSASQVDLQGLLLAGIVIGTLGVLEVATVRQTSAVWERRRTDPDLSLRQVYGGAIRAGREHIASSVNTLVLAYAGAALPLFLVLTQAQQRLSDTATSEVVATEIVRALVGSIGLVACVPATTLLAAWVVSPRDAVVVRNDPRRYRSRAERAIWAAEAAPPPTVDEPAPPPAL